MTTTRTVLAVDDEPDVLDFVQIVLSDSGYSVLTAPDGEVALGLLEDDKEQSIDLLFSDVMMPRMSGFALAAKARGLRPDIPVVLASGYVAVDVAKAISEGDIPLLAKPFRPAQLLAEIERALQK